MDTGQTALKQASLLQVTPVELNPNVWEYRLCLECDGSTAFALPVARPEFSLGGSSTTITFPSLKILTAA